MNQETMLYLYHKMSDMIEERRRDRTIVLLGDSEVYRTFLREKYGQEEVMLLTTIKKKASDKVVYIGDIRHQNDKYFIVVPRIKKTLDLQLKLHSFGYTDFEDCYWIPMWMIIPTSMATISMRRPVRSFWKNIPAV